MFKTYHESDRDGRPTVLKHVVISIAKVHEPSLQSVLKRHPAARRALHVEHDGRL